MPQVGTSEVPLWLGTATSFSWLVVDRPLWKIWVRQWEGLYIPYMMENKTCSKPPTSFAALLNSGVHRGPLSPQQASGGFSVGLKPAGRDVSHGGRTPWPVLIGGSVSKTGVTGWVTPYNFQIMTDFFGVTTQIDHSATTFLGMWGFDIRMVVHPKHNGYINPSNNSLMTIPILKACWNPAVFDSTVFVGEIRLFFGSQDLLMLRTNRWC